MRHCRLKKVISAKGKILWYLGDGLWFGRTSQADAELGLSTGAYVLWETVDHRPAPEPDTEAANEKTESEAVEPVAIAESSESTESIEKTEVEAVESVANAESSEITESSESIESSAIAESIETQNEPGAVVLTDAQVIDEVLEAVGLKLEYGEEATVKYGDHVNIAVAREWLAKCEEADQKLADFKAENFEIYELYKKLRVLRQPLFAQRVGMEDVDSDPQIEAMNQRIEELKLIRDAKNAIYEKASNKAWDLSKGILTPEPKQPKRAKPQKDYNRLVEYWDKKLDGVIYKLKRASGALETAEKRYEQVSGAGRELVTHFPLGLVGGSGKNVKALNKKKGDQLDRTIDALKEVEAAKARVSRLQSTFDRYQCNYEKAVEKRERQIICSGAPRTAQSGIDNSDAVFG